MDKATPQRHDVATEILTHLLKNPNDFVSGNELGKSIGISRVSVWNALKSLSENGFKFQAIKNKGYRLESEPTHVNIHLLKAYMAEFKTSIPITVLEEIDSTNSEAQRQLASKDSPSLAVIALRQTKGRGRHGRTWHSQSSGNLYISFGFRPTFRSELLSSFTPYMAVHLCHMLNTEFNIPVFVKWPNDLILADKKVSGMLAEARIDIDHIYDLIFGIGLNITPPQEWPSEIKDKAIALGQKTKAPLSINKIAAAILKTGCAGFSNFTKQNSSQEFLQLWEKYDFLKDKNVQAYEGNDVTAGIARGISTDATLRLELPDGTIKKLVAGEVSLSKPIK